MCCFRYHEALRFRLLRVTHPAELFDTAWTTATHSVPFCRRGVTSDPLRRNAGKSATRSRPQLEPEGKDGTPTKDAALALDRAIAVNPERADQRIKAAGHEVIKRSAALVEIVDGGWMELA